LQIGISLTSLQEFHEGRRDTKILLCFANPGTEHVFGFVPTDPIPLYNHFKSHLQSIDEHNKSPKLHQTALSAPSSSGNKSAPDLLSPVDQKNQIDSNAGEEMNDNSLVSHHQNDEDDDDDDNITKCVICLDRRKPVCLIFLKCLHLCLCEDCGPDYAQARKKRHGRKGVTVNVPCPVCQKFPNQMKKVFRP